MKRRLLHTDDGFSLSELLVVIALMGIVLSGAWALFRLASMGAAQSSQQAWISREVGQPLENAERAFSQQSPPLQEVDRYFCTIRTDQDRDDLYEVHRFEATTDGRLIVRYHEELPSPTAVPVTQTRVWSRHNANRTAGIPLFTYLDANGADISTTSAANIKQKAMSVIVTIVTVHEGKQYSDSRQVFFRNQ